MNLLTKNFLILQLVMLVGATHASPLFDDESVLPLSLTGPLSTLIKNKKKPVELPFVLHADGTDHDVKVRVRGKSRLRVCRFLPLRINFAKGKTVGTVFEGQDKLKLVTHCKPGDRSRTDLLEEYAAYKIFGIISDVGYRVRLLRISYADTDGRFKDKAPDHFAFFIESGRGMEARLGASRIHTDSITLGSLSQRQAALVFIFHYLIGNTDWSLVSADLDDECCHNGDLFEIGNKRYVVPYDFDLSGLVNASYAKPDASIGISRVTLRRYRGYCIPVDALQEALRSIKGKKAQILNVFDQISGLSDKQIRWQKKYLEKFFDEAEKPQKLLSDFERRCL